MRSSAPPLLPIFRSRHQAELLAWLFLHQDQEYGITELARRMGVPLTTLHREAHRLVEAGLLEVRSIGRNRMLRANSRHRAAAPLTQLLELSFGPQIVIGQEFALPRVEMVRIFGSWAQRHSGNPGPAPDDVDVLVVGSPKRADVYEAADRAQARLGLPVNPVVRSSQLWTSGDDPLVEQIKMGASTTVFGGDDD